MPIRQLRKKRNQVQARRGAAAVEFALVAPVFFLIVFALFEFAWTNVIRHTADNAAYEATRAAMVPGATSADAIARANRILNAVGTRGATVTVNPNRITRATKEVQVTIDIPLRLNALVTPRFTGGTTIRASSTQRTERADAT